MTISDPLGLLKVLQDFINARTWAESRRIIEKAPELLSDEADLLLERVLGQYEDDPQTTRILCEHRELLRLCREEGIEAAFEELETVVEGSEASGVDAPPRFQDAVEALVQLKEQAQNDPTLAARLVQGLQRLLSEIPQGKYLSFRAAIYNELGVGHANLPTGDRGENLKRAITYFEHALSVYTPELTPYDYAMTQNNMGNAYHNLPIGDRNANLARAIACYKEALRFWTAETAPFEYAGTQNNLGLVYSDLATGDPGENLARAIACYKEALRFRTPESAPYDCAATQSNLGNAYLNLPADDRGENLARAVACYQQALQFQTRETAPFEYAGIQNNLGNAYRNFPTGDPGKNLSRAMECYQRALSVYTRETAPFQYATTQNNLGTTYLFLPAGNRGKNLTRAIACFEQALTIFTPEAAPFEYAGTHNNLGEAYRNLPTGDRRENLTRAIACYQQALRFRTPEAAPIEYAATQNNLGAAYADLPRRDQGENLARAIACYQQALRFQTPEAAPLDYAMTQNNLGNAYARLRSGDRGQNAARAIACFEQALTVYTPEAAPLEYAMTQNNLGVAYLHLSTGDRGKNLTRGIACFEQALAIYTSETAPLEFASTQNNLGEAYRNLTTGNRVENLTQAIACFEQAVSAYTPEVWPERARDVLRRLGASHFSSEDWRAAHEQFVKARELTEQFYGDALLREVQEEEAGANAVMYAQDAFCLVELGDLPGAWGTLEIGRARGLREGLDRRRARRALETAPAAVRERYEDVAAQERALRDALQRPLDDPLRRAYHEVRGELAAVRDELRVVLGELLNSAGIEVGVTHLQALQETELLQEEGTALLGLAVTEHGTLALILTGKGLGHIILDGLTQVRVRKLVLGSGEDSGLGGWLGAYFGRFTASSHWRGTIADTLEALGERLWADLDAALQAKGIKRTMLMPQGLLFLLPLHACPLNGDELVCDRYSVAYAPAGTVLARLSEEELVSQAKRALVVANPTGDLRYTPSEALMVDGALEDATTLWEEVATRVQMITLSGDAEVIHFSGHGIYDWTKPEESGLLLSPDKPDANQVPIARAERFTVAEMREMLNLGRTRLVTLSACETGLLEIRRGLADEYIGLPGILLQAGAHTVVASLWAVDDFATTLLMGRFYAEWQQGAIPIAEALRRAQEWLRTRTRKQVDDALESLYDRWKPLRVQREDPRMRRRAIDQGGDILNARRRLREMDDFPFAHPYWWAAFQAVGDAF